jgi:DNA-binding beta-propeller fold protein YncE
MKTKRTKVIPSLAFTAKLALAAMLPAAPTTGHAADTIYVASYHDTIQQFTPTGVGSVFADTGLSGPAGLAFDSAGNLYVANSNNGTIEKFTPQGVGSIFANVDTPTFIAIVPEPSTWMMFGLAFPALLTLCAGRKSNGERQRRRLIRE